MIRQKKGFLTFIFSLLPGAGEMYMGFFKQGISIMLGFFGIAAIASLSGLSVIAILIPIVWFYSFFHVHNLASMPLELFSTMEDHYLFLDNDEQLKEAMQSKKARKVLAIALIIIGAFSLWDILTDFLLRLLPDFAWETMIGVTRTVPQCLLALLIIYLGIVLIKGKKKELDEVQDNPITTNFPDVDAVVVDSTIVEAETVTETKDEEKACQE